MSLLNGIRRWLCKLVGRLTRQYIAEPNDGGCADVDLPVENIQSCYFHAIYCFNHKENPRQTFPTPTRKWWLELFHKKISVQCLYKVEYDLNLKKNGNKQGYYKYTYKIPESYVDGGKENIEIGIIPSKKLGATNWCNAQVTNGLHNIYRKSGYYVIEFCLRLSENPSECSFQINISFPRTVHRVRAWGRSMVLISEYFSHDVGSEGTKFEYDLCGKSRGHRILAVDQKCGNTEQEIKSVLPYRFYPMKLRAGESFRSIIIIEKKARAMALLKYIFGTLIIIIGIMAVSIVEGAFEGLTLIPHIECWSARTYSKLPFARKDDSEAVINRYCWVKNNKENRKPADSGRRSEDINTTNEGEVSGALDKKPDKKKTDLSHID